MNSGRKQREVAHRRATALAAGMPCLSCGRPAPSLPAHWPRHRGMGGGNAGWDIGEWVPLCYDCHEVLDHRNGASEAASAHSQDVRDRVALGAPVFLSLLRRAHG